MSDFPEHEKMAAVIEVSQGIGEFLEWGLQERNLYLCEHDAVTGQMMPLRVPIIELLAEHFGIDLKKMEEEKQKMLIILRGLE